MTMQLVRHSLKGHCIDVSELKSAVVIGLWVCFPKLQITLLNL